MAFLTSFIESIKLPKKKSVFKLNRISMDIVVVYLASLFTKFSGRRLHYSILWKMTAFSTTLPFLVYTILAFFYNISDNFLWLSFLYTAFLLYKIITIYPKRKH